MTFYESFCQMDLIGGPALREQYETRMQYALEQKGVGSVTFEWGIREFAAFTDDEGMHHDPYKAWAGRGSGYSEGDTDA